VSSRSETEAPAPPAHDTAVSRSGLAFAIAAYALWGFLPIYFIALEPAGPIEIVGWRVLLSLVFCLLLLTVTRAWRPFMALVRDRRILFTMGLAGVLIFVNWSTYVYATLTDTFSFPTVAQLLSVVPASTFTGDVVPTTGYELADRCPILVLDVR